MFRKLICVVLLFSCAISFSQRIKIDKKKLQFLTNETTVGVELRFPEHLVIDGFNLTLPFPDTVREIRGNQSSEKEFVEKMKKKWGVKDSAIGENWVIAYEKAKESDWRDQFIQSINKEIEKYSDFRFVTLEENTDYILVIEADWMYFGYGKVQIARNGAKMRANLKFVKSSDQETILYETVTPNILGGYVKGEFGDIVRMGNCYDKLGYLLSLQLKRVLK